MALVSSEALVTLDDATASLAIQLQLDDCQQLLDRGKGKNRESDHNDVELALRLCMEELSGNASIILDRRMTRSIANAVLTDGQVLVGSLVKEDQIAQDRRLAHNLSGNHADPNAVSGVGSSSRSEATDKMDDEMIEKLKVLYVAEFEDIIDEQRTCIPDAESSARGETRISNTSHLDQKRTCCFEYKKFFDVGRAPCGHQYCRDCLEDLFQASLTDESLFPPRCCRQHISPDAMRIFLKPDIYFKYEKRKIELAIPNRTYCNLPGCSAFIHPDNIVDQTGTCPDCSNTTCTICKSESHRGDCPNDTELQQVLEIATDNHWQRCYSCRTVVELNYGCNHITCRCGAQFCYVCGQRWKECGCEQWTEHRLIARAEQLVNRGGHNAFANHDAVGNPQEGRAPPIEDELPVADGLAEFETNAIQREMPEQQVEGDERAGRNILVGQAMQHLLRNHNCEHRSWNFTPGPHRCEECYHHLRQYIFECRQCRLQACKRCRRNRL